MEKTIKDKILKRDKEFRRKHFSSTESWERFLLHFTDLSLDEIREGIDYIEVSHDLERVLLVVNRDGGKEEFFSQTTPKREKH